MLGQGEIARFTRPVRIAVYTARRAGVVRPDVYTHAAAAEGALVTVGPDAKRPAGDPLNPRTVYTCRTLDPAVRQIQALAARDCSQPERARSLANIRRKTQTFRFRSVAGNKPFSA